MKVIRTSSCIIHRIAMCNHCGWRDEDQFHASKRARRHSEQTGHTTVVENGNFYEFKRADGKPPVDDKQTSLLEETESGERT